MKIRLIIPECSRFNKGYCADSWNPQFIQNRIQALHAAMQSSDVDMVVTSHNYFFIDPKHYTNAGPIINNILIKNYLSKIPADTRKPLVIGFDIESSTSTSKNRKRTKGYNAKRKAKGDKAKTEVETYLNPYGGIDAIVCFLALNASNEFTLKTHIWEAWKDGQTCDKDGFVSQNSARVFQLKGHKVGLLSCGDMFSYCHDRAKNLPEVDIYLDLAHKAYTGRYKRTPGLILEQKKASKMYITMQVKDITGYDKCYPWTFPDSAKNLGTEYSVGDQDKSWFAFIDCKA